METPHSNNTLSKFNMFTSSYSKLFSNPRGLNMTPSSFSFYQNKLSTFLKKPISPRFSSAGSESDIYPKKLKFNNCNINFNRDNCNEIHNINVKKSEYKMKNVNFNIDLSFNQIKTSSGNSHKFSKFLSTASNDKTLSIKVDNKSPCQIKKTLKFNSKNDFSDLKEKLKYSKPLHLIKEDSDDKDYLDVEVDDMLEYIFDPSNNLKKEYEKNKTSNSCKCKKTGCSKYSCSCLRNGNKCDFLCSCKTCGNKKDESIKKTLINKT